MVKGAPEPAEEEPEEFEQLPGRLDTQDGDETEDELELPEFKPVKEPESSSPPPIFSSDVVAGTLSSSGISSRFPPARYFFDTLTNVVDETVNKSFRLPRYSSPASSVTANSSREASPEEQDKGTGSAELDQIIKAMTEEDPVNIDQYLDHDDDEGSTLAEDDDESDYDSDAAEAAKRTGKNKSKSNTSERKKNENWQESFQCMKPNDGKLSIDNPNIRTIQILSEMEKEYSTQGDHWRTLGYRKAVASLKKQNVKISTYDQAIALSGVGHRIAEKIVEIVTTDRLQRLEFAKMEPGDQLIKTFTKIYGVGYTTAQKFVNAGYKSLNDVATKAKLSEAQKNGLKYYDDFQKRIPRDEVTKHYKIVEKAAAKIDKGVVTHVMGSYRRKAPDCGDIDIIITKSGGTAQSLTTFLQQLVQDLTASGFLLCGLAMPGRRESGSKWHGASRVGDDGIARRIDFLIVPEAEIGAALIYFTGDDIFNRSLRLLASKKGMRLNQRGLFKDVMRGKGREHLNDGTLIEGYSETVSSIFSFVLSL